PAGALEQPATITASMARAAAVVLSSCLLLACADCVDAVSLPSRQPWSKASGRRQWWQGWLPQIWRSPMTADAVDHGGGGRETRRDPVLAGLPQHDPGDRRPLAVDPADGAEGEAAAG